MDNVVLFVMLLIIMATLIVGGVFFYKAYTQISYINNIFASAATNLSSQ